MARRLWLVIRPETKRFTLIRGGRGIISVSLRSRRSQIGSDARFVSLRGVLFNDEAISCEMDKLEKRLEMKDNPTISRIRRTRTKISARFGHSTKKLVHHYMKLQEKHKHKLITASESHVHN